MRISACVWLVCAATAAAACQVNGSPVSPSSNSWFSATLTGTAVPDSGPSTYEGGGWFQTTQNRPAAPPMFILQSEGTGSARQEGFELLRQGYDLPATGTYSLGAQSDGGLRMIYTRRQGNITMRYEATSGQLHITSSSPERIAGSFQFSGILAGTCSSSGGSVSCSVGRDPGQHVEATGSFEAARR